MAENNLNPGQANGDDIYGMITQLCELIVQEDLQTSSNKQLQHWVKHARSVAYSLLLGKNHCQDVSKTGFEEMDPVCSLIAHSYVLRRTGKREESCELDKCIKQACNFGWDINPVPVLHSLVLLADSVHPVDSVPPYGPFNPLRLLDVPDLNLNGKESCALSYPTFSPNAFIPPPWMNIHQSLLDSDAYPTTFPFDKTPGEGLPDLQRFNSSSGKAGPSQAPHKPIYQLPAILPLTGPCELTLAEPVPQRLTLDDEGYVTPVTDIGETECGSNCAISGFVEDPTEVWSDALNTKLSQLHKWEALGDLDPKSELPFLSAASQEAIHHLSNLHKYSMYFVLTPGSALVVDDEEVSRDKFVRDILVLLAGTESQSFPFDKGDDQFKLRPGLWLEGYTYSSLSSLCQDFIDCGTYFKRIEALSQSKTSQETGLMVHTLCASLRRWTVFYRAAVLVLSDYVTSLKAPVLLFDLIQRVNPLKHQAECLAKLCHVTGAVDLDKPLPSGVALLAHVYQEVSRSMRREQTCLLYSIFKSCCQVYLRCLERWIFSGDCSDVEQEEFFVHADLQYLVKRDRLYWTRGFTLESATVPDFLRGLEVAIYECGRAVNLLRLCSPQHPLSVLLEKHHPTIRCCLEKSDLAIVQTECACFEEEALKVCGEQMSVVRQMEEEREEQTRLYLMMLRVQEERASARAEEKARVAKERAELKQRQLDELKAQMMAAQQRKIDQEEKSKLEDAKYLEKFKQIEDEANRVDEEQRQKLIAHYDMLNSIIEKRELHADWQLKRLKLTDKRTEFLRSDKASLSEEYRKLQAKNSNATGRNLILHNDPEAVKDQIDDNYEGNNVKDNSSDSAGCSVSSKLHFERNMKQVTKESKQESRQEYRHSDVPQYEESQLESVIPAYSAAINVKTVQPGETEISSEDAYSSSCVRKRTSEENIPQGRSDHPTIPQFDQDQKDRTVLDSKLNVIENSRLGIDRATSADSGFASVKTKQMRNFHRLIETTSGIQLGKVSACGEERIRTGESDSVIAKLNEYPASHTTLPRKDSTETEREKNRHKVMETEFNILTGEVSSKLLISKANLCHGQMLQNSNVTSNVPHSKSSSNDSGIASADTERERNRRRVMGEEFNILTGQSSDLTKMEGTATNMKQADNLFESDLTVRNASIIGSTSALADANVSSIGNDRERNRRKVMQTEFNILTGEPSVYDKKRVSVVTQQASNLSDLEVNRRRVLGEEFNLFGESKYSKSPDVGSVHDEEALDTLSDVRDGNDLEEGRTGVASDPKLNGNPSDVKTTNMSVQGGRIHSDLILSKIVSPVASCGAVEVTVTSASGAKIEFELPNVLRLNSMASVASDFSPCWATPGSVAPYLLGGSHPFSGWISNYHMLFSPVDPRAKEMPQNTEQKKIPLMVDIMDHSSSQCLLGKTPEEGRPALSEVSPNASWLGSALHQCLLLPLQVQHRLVSAALLHYFLADLRLLAHLQSFRSYYFMLDGEFGRHLTCQLFTQMYQVTTPAGLLNGLTLNGLLSVALASSKRANDPNSSRLSFSVTCVPPHFKHYSPNALDCLHLCYSVPWPLNLLFTEETMRKYNEIFVFLVRLRRVAWLLQEDFIVLKSNARHCIKEQRRDLLNSPQYHQVQLMRHCMSQFVQATLNYVSSAVLHASWPDFETELKQAATIDHIYNAHIAYIKRILKRCLLNRNSRRVEAPLSKVLVDILQFHSLIRVRAWQVPSRHSQQPTRIHLEHPSFHKLVQIFETFKFQVCKLVSYLERLVALPHQQQHLAEYLLLLNLNGYYTSSDYLKRGEHAANITTHPKVR